MDLMDSLALMLMGFTTTVLIVAVALAIALGTRRHLRRRDARRLRDTRLMAEVDA